MEVLDAARPLLIESLKREEGLRLKPYLCAAGVPTIGVGATTYPDGRAVKMDDKPITEEVAMRMLAMEADRYLMAVSHFCTRFPTAHQLAALTSLAYNIGLSAFSKSTVLRLHNAGDDAGAARAFALWNKATIGGKLTVVPGLVARRAREAAMYVTADDEAPAEPSPQAVATEPRLVASPTMNSGVLTVAAGAATAVADSAGPDPVSQLSTIGQQASTVQTALQQIKTLIIDTVGIPASWWLPMIVIGTGAVVIYRRWKQRREGVA